MKYYKMPNQYFHELYENLLKLIDTCNDPNEGRDDEMSQTFQIYSLNTDSGKLFYNNITDKQLLDILKQTAVKKNHSPSQKEVFWVLREYIKLRFKKWPYALEAAGLTKAAGAGSKTLKKLDEEAQEYQYLLIMVKEKARELCWIPHPQDVPDLCEKLKKYTNSWNQVIKDAKIDQQLFKEKSVYKIEDLEEEYQDIIREIKDTASTFGRAPLKSEIDSEKRRKLIARCGSWRNALYQIGLEPVIRINPFSSTHLCAVETEKERSHKTSLQDCYYRVLNPDEQTIADLTELYILQKKLHHTPDKKDVSPDLRKRLQASCGSWANSLFQLEYTDILYKRK